MYLEIIFSSNENVANYTALTKHSDAFVFVDDPACFNQWERYANEGTIIVTSFKGNIPFSSFLALIRADSIPQYNSNPVELIHTKVCVATTLDIKEWYNVPQSWFQTFITKHVNIYKYVALE